MSIDAIQDDLKDYLPSDNKPKPTFNFLPQIEAALQYSCRSLSMDEHEVVEIILPADPSPIEKLLESRGLMFANNRQVSSRDFTFVLADHNQPDIILCKNIFGKVWEGLKDGAKQLGKNVKHKAERVWNEAKKGAEKVNEWVKEHAGDGRHEVGINLFDFGPNNNKPNQIPQNQGKSFEDRLLEPSPLAQNNQNSPIPQNVPYVALPQDQLFPHNPYYPSQSHSGSPFLTNLPDHQLPTNSFADTVATQQATNPTTPDVNASAPLEPTAPSIVIEELPPEENDGFFTHAWRVVKTIFAEGVHEIVGLYDSAQNERIKLASLFGFDTAEETEAKTAALLENAKDKHEAIDGFFGSHLSSRYDPEIQAHKRALGLEPVNGFIPFGPGLAGRVATIESSGIQLVALPRLAKGLTFEEIPLVLREIEQLQAVGALEVTAQNALLYEHANGWLKIRFDGIWEIEGKNIKTFDFRKVIKEDGKWEHLFKSEHRFDQFNCLSQDILSLVTKSVLEADQAGQIPLNQPFKMRFPVNELTVEVHGIVIDGELRYGTIFIPKE